jgi:sporulation protein YlmC with PRC-barrel domain
MPIIPDTELLGKRVITDDAADVGELGDIYVDIYDWHVTKFDLRIEKKYAERLGLETGLMKRPTVQIKTYMVRAVGDVVHLKGGLDELRQGTKAVQPPKPEGPAPAAAPATTQGKKEKDKDRDRDRDKERAKERAAEPKRSRPSYDASDDKPRGLQS